MQRKSKILFSAFLGTTLAIAVPLTIVACGSSTTDKVKAGAATNTVASVALVHVKGASVLPTATPPDAIRGYVWDSEPTYLAADATTVVALSDVNAASFNSKFWILFTAKLDIEKYQSGKDYYTYAVPFYVVSSVNIKPAAVRSSIVASTIGSYIKGDEHVYTVSPPTDVGEGHLAWTGPVYQGTKGAILSLKQVQALEAGATFSAVYTSDINITQYYGDSCTFTQNFTVAAAENIERRTAAATVSFGSAVSAPEAIADYNAPVLDANATTYATTDEVGTIGKIAVYKYQPKNASAKVIMLTENLTITKAVAPTDFDHLVYGNKAPPYFGTFAPYSPLTFTAGSAAPTAPFDGAGAALAAPFGFRAWNASVAYLQNMNLSVPARLLSFVKNSETTLKLPTLPIPLSSPPPGYGALAGPSYQVTFVSADYKTSKFENGDTLDNSNVNDLNFSDTNGTKFSIRYTALPSGGNWGNEYYYQAQYKALVTPNSVTNAPNSVLNAEGVAGLQRDDYFTATFTAPADTKNFNFASPFNFVYTAYYRVAAAAATAAQEMAGNV